MSIPSPSPREPMINAPRAIVAVLVLLVLVQVVRDIIPDPEGQLLFNFAFVPARFAVWLDPGSLDQIANEAVDSLAGGSAVERVQFVRLAIGDGDLKAWTFVTYAGLHASWTHLLFNGLWLLAFGSPVARRLGSARFIVFLCICAVAGAFAHWLVHARDVMPMVGASAAISGAMAAACRFALRSDVAIVILRTEPNVLDRLPAQSLSEMLSDRRVVMFLLVWFGTNLVVGLLPGLAEGTVAWEAHVGGFLAGLFLFPLFDPISRSRLPTRT